MNKHLKNLLYIGGAVIVGAGIGMSEMKLRELFYPPAPVIEVSYREQLESGFDIVYGAEFDEQFDIYFNDDREWSFDELMQFVIRMDAMLDKMPVPDYNISQETMDLWVAEILPYFQYENTTNDIKTVEILEFEQMMTGLEHIHVLGHTDKVDWLTLNFRYSNEISVWYGSPEFLPTLVHELFHIQQGSYVADNYSESEIETSAEIVTLEVLAAMANHGNYYSAYSLIYMLRNMAMGSLRVVAMEEKRVEEYETFRAAIYPGAVAQAAYEKSDRFWQNQYLWLQSILKDYKLTPLNKILYAHKEYYDIVTDMALDYISPSNYRDYMIENVRPDPSLRVDDLMYFLEHAEEIVKDRCN